VDELIEFLLLRLDDDQLDQLDEHQERRFPYTYMPRDRPGEERLDHAHGCAACTQDPREHGGPAGWGTDWIEEWPCRHLCGLALPFSDDPEFRPQWRERLSWGARFVIHPGYQPVRPEIPRPHRRAATPP
jgi:hypothetical protein